MYFHVHCRQSNDLVRPVPAERLKRISTYLYDKCIAGVFLPRWTNYFVMPLRLY